MSWYNDDYYYGYGRPVFFQQTEAFELNLKSFEQTTLQIG